MSNIRKCLLFVFIFCATFTARAQKLLHYDLADGLSSSEITSICENDYYMWIATEDGLNRFDGHRFKVYKSGKATNNSLKNNNIETLFLDSKGLLWIGFKTGGVDIYNPRTDQFIHLNEQVSAPIPNRIVSIFEDSDHNIWLGSWEEGICKLTPKNTERTSFTAERSHSGAIVSSFVEKPKGHIWISTYTGLVMYNSRKQIWANITPKNQTITQIHDTGEENTLYYSSWDNALYGLTWSQQPEQARTIHLYNSNTPIYRIEGEANKLLIGTWGEGIKVYDKEQERIYPLPGTEHLGTTFINTIYKDSLDNIWIGSYGKGLYKYSSSDRGINQLLSIRKTHSPITSIALLQDKILLGTLGDGMYHFDMRTSTEKENYKSRDKFKDHILSIGQNKDCLLYTSPSPRD